MASSSALLLMLLIAQAACGWFAGAPPVFGPSNGGSHRAPRTSGVYMHVNHERIGAIMRDALMKRSVELQLGAFALVKDVACQTWLSKRWESFVQCSSEGHLTDFFEVLRHTEPEQVFVPTKSFRVLSPANPHASQEQRGFTELIQPSKIALRLVSCRTQLAATWEDELARLVDFGCGDNKQDPPEGDARPASPFSSSCRLERSLMPSLEDAADEQLLRGLATRLAVQELLHDLELLPSQAHLHSWLSSFILLNHATDLTEDGSVPRLLSSLASQPVHIRGSALVDPLSLTRDIVERSEDIMSHFAMHLREAPSDHAGTHADFLESCLDL